MKKISPFSILPPATVFNLLITALCIVTVFFIHIPFGKTVYKKAKELHYQYQIKKDAVNFPIKMSRIKNEISILDSLFKTKLNIQDSIKGNFAEMIYLMADSAGFKTSKVEIGEKLPVLNYQETSVCIRGMGSYTETGKLVESIENSNKSTRIREIVLREGEKKGLEAFVEFVIVE